MDIETLHSDILTALPADPIPQAHVSDTTESWWSVDESGLLTHPIALTSRRGWGVGFRGGRHGGKRLRVDG